MPADCESLAPAHATIQVPTTGRYPSVSPDLTLPFRLAHVARGFLLRHTSHQSSGKRHLSTKLKVG